MPRKRWSLRSRLLLTATLVLLTFLGLMGIVLDQAFQRSAEQSVNERLQLHIYGLLSVMEVDTELYLPEALQEPRFNNPGSGLFALVLDDNSQELWRSPSAVALSLEDIHMLEVSTSLSPGQTRFERLSDGQYFYLSYPILWVTEENQEKEFLLVVLESTDGYERQISGFRNNLWGWLLGVVLVLVIVQGVVMRWGLRPLADLAEDLKAIEDGERDHLSGSYPDELTGVTKNLNLLITSERQQREKYRTTLGDLAHSLKTPLAILKTSASNLQAEAALKDQIDEQVARMDQIIGYQLERAVTDTTQLIKRSIPVKPVIERLIKAMERVYQDKGITVELALDDGEFFGDERDLMEMLGNLVDNAFKYGREKVRVSMASGEATTLFVEDDGPGIPPVERPRVLARGIRLDSQEQGQGIGLAVVCELVERYKGTIEIEDSELGGALVRLRFS